MILWQLFVSYLKIGFFGFGGGYAMLSLIQHEVVVRHAWMTAGEFADIVAISQITPGPIAINSATYVGYTVGMQTGHVGLGILGSAIATFAVCLPSLTLMILVARFFMRLHNNRLVEGAMRGMRPTVIGMIAAAALLLIFPHGSDPDERNFIDGWSWALFGPLGRGGHPHLPRLLTGTTARKDTKTARRGNRRAESFLYAACQSVTATTPSVDNSSSTKSARKTKPSTATTVPMQPQRCSPPGSGSVSSATISPTRGVKITLTRKAQPKPMRRRLPMMPTSTDRKQPPSSPKRITRGAIPKVKGEK